MIFRKAGSTFPDHARGLFRAVPRGTEGAANAASHSLFSGQRHVVSGAEV